MLIFSSVDLGLKKKGDLLLPREKWKSGNCLPFSFSAQHVHVFTGEERFDYAKAATIEAYWQVAAWEDELFEMACKALCGDFKYKSGPKTVVGHKIAWVNIARLQGQRFPLICSSFPL